MSATTTTRPPLSAVRDALRAALPGHIARIGWSREQIVVHQREQLAGLLAHAMEHSPFHARRLAGLDPAAVDPGDLSGLPVMTRAETMAELDDVLTDRRLTRASVEQALSGAGPDPAMVPGPCLALASGGSSGERAVFVLDVPGAVQYFGSLARGMAARLAATGGPPPGGLTIAMVAAASPVHATAVSEPLCADGRLGFRFVSVPVTSALPEIVERLNALSPHALYGYPTVLAQLAVQRSAGRLRISPTMITSTSETCTPELRASITGGFGAPVIDSFGSTEGLIGASGPGEDVMTFAEDGCIVELVDGDHRPVPPGTPSSRVLITVLGNRIQPLIRYELTDSFVQLPGDGHLRARVNGRSDEAFRYGEVTVHPVVLRSVLVRTPDVVEYQVRQTSTGIDVDAVAGPGLDRDDLRVRLAEALAGAGVDGPEVEVRPVRRLDRHAVTGKLRRFVPLR